MTTTHDGGTIGAPVISPSLLFCARYLGPKFSTEAVDEFYRCFMDAARSMRARTDMPADPHEMTAQLLTSALHSVVEHDRSSSPFWRDLMAVLHDALLAAGDQE